MLVKVSNSKRKAWASLSLFFVELYLENRKMHSLMPRFHTSFTRAMTNYVPSALIPTILTRICLPKLLFKTHINPNTC